MLTSREVRTRNTLEIVVARYARRSAVLYEGARYARAICLAGDERVMMRRNSGNMVVCYARASVRARLCALTTRYAQRERACHATLIFDVFSLPFAIPVAVTPAAADDVLPLLIRRC